MTYREQDPEALRMKISDLEEEVASLRAKPRKRRLTRRGWLLIWHFVCLSLVSQSIIWGNIGLFGMRGEWAAVGIPAALWAIISVSWMAALGDNSYGRGIHLTEPADD